MRSGFIHKMPQADGALTKICRWYIWPQGRTSSVNAYTTNHLKHVQRKGSRRRDVREDFDTVNRYDHLWRPRNDLQVRVVRESEEV